MQKLFEINKNVNDGEIALLYINNKLSIPEISKITGICRSTIRLHLIKYGIKLRSKAEGVRLHPEKNGRKGIKRNMTEEWKQNIKTGRIKYCEKNSKGKSLKPSGYYEITRGLNKGRPEHDVIIEGIIGRKLNKNEVVHHINGVKTDNNIENLQLMLRKDHSKLHIMNKIFIRDKKGKFVKLLNK